MGRHVMKEEPPLRRSPWFWPLICLGGLLFGVLGGTIAAILFT